MRMREIFPAYHKIFAEDNDAAIANADQAMLSAKRSRKQAEIGKTKDLLTKRQGQLQKLNTETPFDGFKK
ncbi:MAG: hypothetical protein WCO00_12615 [Rhodospirillaceae bacterium]